MPVFHLAIADHHEIKTVILIQNALIVQRGNHIAQRDLHTLPALPRPPRQPQHLRKGVDTRKPHQPRHTRNRHRSQHRLPRLLHTLMPGHQPIDRHNLKPTRLGVSLDRHQPQMLHRHRRIHPRTRKFLRPNIGSPVGADPRRIDQQNRHATTRPTPPTSNEHPLTSDRHDAGRPRSRTPTGGDVSKRFSANNIVILGNALSQPCQALGISSYLSLTPQGGLSADRPIRWMNTMSAHRGMPVRGTNLPAAEIGPPCVAGPKYRIAAQLQAGADTSRRRLIRRLVLRATGSSTFPVAGFAWNTFCFAFIGDLFIEPVDDVLQLLRVVQVLAIEFSHLRFRRGRILRLARRRCEPLATPYPAARGW